MRVLPKSLAGLLVLAFFAAPAEAHGGWISWRNDTGMVLVIQETVLVNRQARTGKPQRLLPGELTRDAQLCPCLKRVTVFDPKNPTQPLYQGQFACGTDNVLFSIQGDARGLRVLPLKAQASTNAATFASGGPMAPRR